MLQVKVYGTERKRSEKIEPAAAYREPTRASSIAIDLIALAGA